MGKEIERKFLVSSDGWRAYADAGRRLRQVYLAETEKAAVRIRLDDDHSAWLTIKSVGSGLSRQEFEYEVPVVDAEDLLALRSGSVLEKTRFRVPHAGSVWEVDVYAGDNDGLTIAEIELPSETAEFDKPDWLGPEVTGDRRYYAARLAVEPFRRWPAGNRGTP